MRRQKLLQATRTAYRRLQVATLYRERKTQAQIALALGISQATVSRDLKFLHQEWLARRRVPR